MICTAKQKRRTWYANNVASIIPVLWHARKQIGCGLEVLGNKVIGEEENISHEERENSEILAAYGDDDHAPINICELLMDSEFIEIQTHRDN